jgi:TPR repeat protein
MKKIILTTVMVLGFVVQGFAQNNDMKARMEFEDAETAYQNGDYEKTITHLTEAEKLLGFWTAKVAYLKIIVLDRIIDYGQEWNDNMAELYRQVKEYMKYANKSPDKIDTDKMREVYAIEKRIDGRKQEKEWEEMFEYKKGMEAFDNKNYEEAMSWFEKAADKGNAGGINDIGYLYHYGYGVKQNYTEAMKWYKKAVDKGNPSAIGNIGSMYLKGEGVVKDYQEAVNWYKKVADRGIAVSMSLIGKLYHTGGNGVTQNYQEAMNWYKKAADKGNVSAMNNIGTLYFKGEGVTQNYQEAMNWYRKAAGKGNVSAMYEMGNMFRIGAGISKNYTEAINWYEKAINAGYDYKAGAMANIGYCYFQLQNYTKSMEWYKKAYEVAGDADTKRIAKNWIAKMYEEGLGVEKDKKLAKEWQNK